MDSVEELLGLAPLEIGDRVRVRLSGECRLCSEVRHVWLDGSRGTFVRKDRRPLDRKLYPLTADHVYWVQHDEPYLSPLVGRIQRTAFARVELERVDPDAAGAGEGEAQGETISRGLPAATVRSMVIFVPRDRPSQKATTRVERSTISVLRTAPARRPYRRQSAG